MGDNASNGGYLGPMFIRGLALALLFLFGLGAVNAAAEEKTYAFLDPVMTSSPEGLALELAAREAELCTASPARVRPPSAARAVKKADRLLRRKAGRRALRTFAKSRHARSAPRAMAAAAGATAEGKPHAALAALLHARKLKPRDPRPLIAAAPVLTNLGMPNEALSFLKAAAKLKQPKRALFGIKAKAGIANNRGFALLALGQWAGAEREFERAVRVSPELNEAHLNLAHALVCRKKPAEAGRAFFIGARRTRAAQKDIVGQSETTRIASTRLLDLSKGVTPALRPLRFPGSMTEGAQLWESYAQLSDTAFDESLALQRESSTARNDAYTHLRTRPPATRRRATALIRAAATVDDEPDIRALGERADTLSSEFSSYFKTYITPQNPPDCGRWGQMKSTFAAYETAQRQYITESYRRMTAIGAHLKTPQAHTAVMTEARYHVSFSMAQLINRYVNLTFYARSCASDEDQVLEATDRPDVVAGSASCPSGLAGKSFGLTFLFAQLSVDCENVSLEVEAGGVLGGFVKVSKNFKNGKTTIYGGPRGKAGAFGVGGNTKTGIYVTAGGDGSISDVGIRVEAGVDLGAGPASAGFDAGSMDFTLMGLSSVASN